MAADSNAADRVLSIQAVNDSPTADAISTSKWPRTRPPPTSMRQVFHDADNDPTDLALTVVSNSNLTAHNAAIDGRRHVRVGYARCVRQCGPDDPHGCRRSAFVETTVR
jgi:hypothetical protein